MEIELNTAYSFSQKGQRDYQEDSRFPDADIALAEQRFFVVCDGVGGCEKGEVASQTVCKSIGKSMSQVDFRSDFTNDDFHRVLDVAYNALDRVASKEKSDMGTTMTFVCFHEGGCTMAHIGDSRIYQIRPTEGIVYRSDDHSLVNSMVHNGMITPDEGLTHSQRNVITRFMEPVSADQNRCTATVIRTKDIKVGDYFLLCTDGVLHCASDDQLLQLARSSESDESVMRQLAEMSKDSEDNNTAWLVSVKAIVPDENSFEDEWCDDSAIATRRLPRNLREHVEIKSVQKRVKGFRKWLNKLFK